MIPASWMLTVLTGRSSLTIPVDMAEVMMGQSLLPSAAVVFKPSKAWKCRARQLARHG